MKRSRLALFQSLISLLLCCSMLIGTTFAWFTDGVTSGNNTIAAGTLDIELEYRDANGNWKDVSASTEVLDKEALWEPGYTEVAYLKVTNAGNLALKYALGVGVISETGSINVAGEDFYLSDHIRFGVIESETETTYATREEARRALPTSSLIIDGPVSTKNVLNEKDDVRYVTLVVYMPEDVGNAANYATGVTPPEINLGIELVATQAEYESDSFGSNYDAAATLAAFNFPEERIACSTSAGVESDKDNNSTSGVTLTDEQASAEIPAGVKLDAGTSVLTLEVTTMDESDANITLEANEAIRSLDVHVKGVAKDNTVPMAITIKEAAPVGLNLGNYKFYHVENGETNAMEYVSSEAAFTKHNQFKYDPATGDITLYMATFSEVALVADTVNAWNGDIDYSWYVGRSADYTIANADQMAGLNKIVSGTEGYTQDDFKDKTVKLIADINFEGSTWYPVGYWAKGGDIATIAMYDAPEVIYEINEDSKVPGATMASEAGSVWYTYGGAFRGTFDGAGHTVANIYQNTWQLKGNYDGNYWNAAMGLFGYVNGGTVKNLTVSSFSSDGEFTPTGVIAAYAAGNSSFENIAIVGCNPRVYNTGNGGIIGIAGDTRAENDDHIVLKNITVDNSNKISALWGSWDVACGGLVGMYRGNVDGSGNATDDTISFENCHVSAIIDVYNDVCANYQYYAYRYAGMIIGSVRHNTKNVDGKVIPDMTGISATGCTVNYGDWNDYYYCEFEKNTMASYSEDYQFSRVPHSELNFTDSNGNGVVDADERASVTGCKHTHTAEENHQAIYLPFHQLFTGYSWGVSSIGLEKYSGIATNLDITEGDQQESVEKFETKFTGEFLYRVGNQNAVSLGSLFAAKEGVKINGSGVVATIDKVDENSNVAGVFNNENKENKKDWTESTIKFSGTGVVKVTIQDYNFCKPTILTLEVVDAVNATVATNATSNNVVLLNDCGFSSLEVSGGYTLYGNGFTMTCGSDSAALDMGYSFVTLNNGTLDNVQIVCPNFDYAVLYKSNMTESGNRSETTDKTRYFNVKSGVMASGNSQILNSRISGARAAVNVSSGNLRIDNSRIELGAVASILVGAANNLILRDVTLVQKPTVSTHDGSKTLMGFSVLLICNSNGDAAPVTLEGTFVQNAWVDESDAQYVPSAGQSIISNALAKTEYLHDLDGDGINESLNLGFAYMPESTGSKVNTTTITDDRTNKTAVPYDYAEVSILNGETYVYSYKNTNGTNDSVKNESDYKPNTQSDIITVNYADNKDGLTTSKAYGSDGWVYELNVDLDKAADYAVDFNKLSMVVNNVAVTDFKVNGNTKPVSPVAVTAGGTTYILTITVNGKEHTAIFKVTGTETTKESPSLVASNYAAALLVGEAGSKYGNKDTWHGAAPALEGIQIKYWSVAEKQYKTIKLSDYTPTNAGKQNGTNTTWTYSPANGDFTLTLTGGQVHSSNNVNAIPVMCGGKLYFVAAASNGLVNYGNSARTIPVTYSFKDNNGGAELKFSHTWSIECADGNTAYDYSDFMNGTSKTFTIKSSNGSGCVTPDTLVTLADGTQKRIDEVTYSDELMVWNFYTGEYAVVRSALIQNHGYAWNNIIKLTFSDGTVTKAINEHGYFDATINEFVMITPDNAGDYVGHEFVKENGDSYTTVTLVSTEVSEEYLEAYSILSAYYYNFITDNMFSLTSPVIETNFFMPFVVNENMTFDAEKLAEDVEKYGLYEYADFEGKIPYEVFEVLNIKFLKVAVAKGLITYDQIIELLVSEGVIE